MDKKITITLPAKVLAKVQSTQPPGTLRSAHYRSLLLAGLDATARRAK